MATELDRDQKKFMFHCCKHLWNYEDVLEEAREAGIKAKQACTVEHQQDNAVLRAFNLVFLDELISAGVEKWRTGKTT